jgi:two-component system chemotaxis response regulator CheY
MDTEFAPATQAPAARVRRLLIVDDALTIRRYHRAIAERAGFLTVEAADGSEALERALRDPPDLLLVDVNMPTMDGYAFLRAVRSHPDLAAIPAVMISTEAEAEDRRLAFEAGANLYLVKPVDDAVLLAILGVLAEAGDV